MKSLKNGVDLLSSLRRVQEPGWEIGNLDSLPNQVCPLHYRMVMASGWASRLVIFSLGEDFGQPKS